MAPLRAFIGDPACPKGYALPCDYCGRRACWRAGPNRELLCARHDVGGGAQAGGSSRGAVSLADSGRLRGAEGALT